MTNKISKEMVDGRLEKEHNLRNKLEIRNIMFKHLKFGVTTSVSLQINNYHQHFPLLSRPPRESFESDLKGESITTSLFAWKRIAGATATALTSCHCGASLGFKSSSCFTLNALWLTHFSEQNEFIYIYIYIHIYIYIYIYIYNYARPKR